MQDKQNFKACTDCKHYLHRHELDNSCAKFKTSQDVLTGWASYKHVREARANEGLCGANAKLYEQQEPARFNKMLGLMIVAWIIIVLVVCI